MNLNLDTALGLSYKSASQKARRITEAWVSSHMYCPNCGNDYLNEFENNRPVADFYCQSCQEEFELKSKQGKLTKTITDGAYSSMIERINSDNNPNFFFLTYSKNWTVDNFLIIPKQFFTSKIIIKRKPLAETAKRAGWIGCSIDIGRIAEAGKVFLVKDAQAIPKNAVAEKFKKTLFLRSQKSETKGWTLDVLACLDRIPTETFTLNEMYAFEESLKQKHPNNNFIKDKLRQQLQILRDRGILEFVSRGVYRKL